MKGCTNLACCQPACRISPAANDPGGNLDGSYGHAPRESGCFRQIRFHPLLRTFLIRQLELKVTPAEMREMHLRIGRAAEASDWLTSAHHYIEAGDYEHGLRYAKQAAIEAEKVFAFDEAIAAYGRARDCGGRQTGAAGRNKRRECRRILRGSHDVNFLRGSRQCYRSYHSRGKVLIIERIEILFDFREIVDPIRVAVYQAGACTQSKLDIVWQAISVGIPGCTGVENGDSQVGVADKDTHAG